MHTHSQGLAPESFWPVILATALAVWQALGQEGEKHQGLAPNFTIWGVQIEMHLQCLYRSVALGKGFLATMWVDAREYMGRRMVSPGCVLSTPPHLGPAQRSLPDGGV